MIRLFTIFLIAGHIAIGVFGVLGMHSQADMQGHGMPAGNCVSAAVNGSDCPQQAGPIDYLTFHLDAFRSFSSATFGDDIMETLVVIYTSLLFIGFTFFSLHLFTPSSHAYNKKGYWNSFSPSQKKQLIRWLALHETSPTFS